MLLSKLWGDFVQLAFPSLCAGCRSALLAEECMVCTVCRLGFPLTYFHNSPDDNPLFDKFKGRLPISYAAAFAYFSDGGIVQSLAHQVKYDGNRELGVYLGRWYGSYLAQSDLSSRFDCLVPVPLHKQRQKERGYNQSACFAKGISQVTGIPMREDLVFRCKSTTSQVRMNQEQRVENTNKAFQLLPNARINHLRILFVDDVITTGATIEACIEPFLGGCADIGILALANV
ncbi:ComF family protein [Rhodoflexus sp.]